MTSNGQSEPPIETGIEVGSSSNAKGEEMDSLICKEPAQFSTSETSKNPPMYRVPEYLKKLSPEAFAHKTFQIGLLNREPLKFTCNSSEELKKRFVAAYIRDVRQVKPAKSENEGWKAGDWIECKNHITSDWKKWRGLYIPIRNLCPEPDDGMNGREGYGRSTSDYATTSTEEEVIEAEVPLEKHSAQSSTTTGPEELQVDVEMNFITLDALALVAGFHLLITVKKYNLGVNMREFDRAHRTELYKFLSTDLFLVENQVPLEMVKRAHTFLGQKEPLEDMLLRVIRHLHPFPFPAQRGLVHQLLNRVGLARSDKIVLASLPEWLKQHRYRVLGAPHILESMHRVICCRICASVSNGKCIRLHGKAEEPIAGNTSGTKPDIHSPTPSQNDLGLEVQLPRSSKELSLGAEKVSNTRPQTGNTTKPGNDSHPESDPDLRNRLPRMPSATRLWEVGITVRPEARELSDIRFETRNWFTTWLMTEKLILPVVYMNESTVTLLRNLAVYVHADTSSHSLMMYLHLMNALVESAEDVSLLCRAGVIFNHYGKNEDLAQAWSKILHGLEEQLQPPDDQFVRIYDGILLRYHTKYPRVWWQYKQINLSSPFMFYGFITFLVVTVCTIFQTYLSTVKAKNDGNFWFSDF